MTIEEFQAVDLRIGTVQSAERVAGSEKLVKIQVDIGEPRQIVSGIGHEYAPEALIGKEVVVVANLDPRKLMGIESQGMLLAAHGTDGKPIVLTVERTAPPGAKVS